MRFPELLALVGAEPLFEASVLLSGGVDRREVQRQLSRWVRAGRLLQLRRGLYALAPPYRQAEPHPFLIANRLVRGSYVSRQSVLAWHGLIPEGVPTVTSNTTGRPGLRETPFGRFDYRHSAPAWFIDHRLEPVAQRQEAFLASPEKALLDLVHLTRGAACPAYLGELRLQNFGALDLEHLLALAEGTGRPKLRRAAAIIVEMAAEEAAYRPL